jgi:hypothetical protein
MTYLKGMVVVESSESLDKVADRISSTLLAGVRFGGADEHIYEEVPALYADVMGLRFVVSGYPDQWYVLKCSPIDKLNVSKDGGKEVDISEHLMLALGTIENATLSLQ